VSYPNQEQAAVLGHLHGTLLVFAPVGMPQELKLVVTFSNRAAKYMHAAKPCRIQTLQELCARTLLALLPKRVPYRPLQSEADKKYEARTAGMIRSWAIASCHD
jgi:hypothetical protein